MFTGILIDPYDAYECPQCGGSKAIGVELCQSCSHWCPDPNHRSNPKQKNYAVELCSSCSAFLKKNEDKDRKRQVSGGFWVYALWTNQGPYYGHSHDPWVRYNSHFNRLVKSTSALAHAPAVKFGPWQTRAQAYRIERTITAVLRRNGSWPYLPPGPNGEISAQTELQRWNARSVNPIW